METSVYANEAIVEANHWWFVGRRKLFAAEIARAGISNDARVLDVGTSTGTNLRLLHELSYRHVTGLDFSQDAIRFCEEKGLSPVRRGDVCAMPFADENFDLVLATDIVEHVDDARGALNEIARVLAPGGTVLITVPAFRGLWGLQDDVPQHKAPLLPENACRNRRRCRIANDAALLFQLSAVCSDLGGAKIDSPFQNSARKRDSGQHARTEPSLIARVIRTAPAIHPPLGVSILAIAQKSRRAS